MGGAAVVGGSVSIGFSATVVDVVEVEVEVEVEAGADGVARGSVTVGGADAVGLSPPELLQPARVRATSATAAAHRTGLSPDGNGARRGLRRGPIDLAAASCPGSEGGRTRG